MNRISQEARRRQAVVKLAMKKGKSFAAKKYGVSLSSVKRWCKRYDGTWQSLRERSHRPKSHPRQHTPQEEELIRQPLYLTRGPRDLAPVARLASGHLGFPCSQQVGTSSGHMLAMPGCRCPKGRCAVTLRTRRRRCVLYPPRGLPLPPSRPASSAELAIHHGSTIPPRP